MGKVKRLGESNINVLQESVVYFIRGSLPLWFIPFQFAYNKDD